MFWWEPRQIVGAQLERVSWAAGASALIYIRGCDDFTSVMSVDGEEIPGKALKKDDVWVSSWKHWRAEMDERWHGNIFQVSEATDEKDLDFAIAGFCEGMDIDKEEEDRSDRVGTYRGTMAVR